MKTGGLIAALLLLAAAGVARADEESQSAASGLFQKLQQSLIAGRGLGTPGEWATYRIRGQGQDSYVRVGVLGREPLPGGEQGTWIEMSFGVSPQGGMLAAKYLTTGDLNDPHRIKRSIVRLAGGKVHELDPKELREVRKAHPGLSTDPSSLPTHPERKTVPGGAFDCERIDLKVGTLWLSMQAPLFHVVAAELNGAVVELYESGKDVKDWVGDPQTMYGHNPDGGLWTRELDGGARGNP